MKVIIIKDNPLVNRKDDVITRTGDTEIKNSEFNIVYWFRLIQN